MKALLGLIQFACGIAGLLALLNGQWLLLFVSWGAGLLVGLAGNRMVRSVEGISQSGQEAVGDISRAIDLLRKGQFAAASGVTRSTVFAFRSGGDKKMLPIALTLHAVALTSIRDSTGAHKALAEASSLLQVLPAEFDSEVADMRQVHAFVQRELDNGNPDPSRFVASFIAFNDAL